MSADATSTLLSVQCAPCAAEQDKRRPLALPLTHRCLDRHDMLDTDILLTGLKHA